MSSLLLNSLPVNYHPYNFAINMFIQHIMQSIGASLVTLSFALDCTVHSAQCGVVGFIQSWQLIPLCAASSQPLLPEMESGEENQTNAE